MLALALAALLAQHSAWPDLADQRLLIAGLLAASFFAVNALPLQLPRGQTIRVDAGVATAALLLADPLTGLLSSLAGGLVAIGVFRSWRQALPEFDVLRRSATLGAVALVYEQFSPALQGYESGAILTGVVVGAAYAFLDLAGQSLLGGLYERSSVPHSFGGMLRLLGWSYISSVCIGVVLSLVFGPLGLLAFLVLVVLMLIMQHTFGLLLRIRNAYTGTVGALVRAVEMQDAEHEGHAERVAELVGQLGRRLGMSSAQIEKLTLAALLHDIGMLGIEARPSDCTREERDAMAASGAAVVAQVGFLAPLAPILSKQHFDYAEYIDWQNEDGLMARVLRVASDFDDLRADADEARARKTLRAAAARAYDPDVLDALDEVRVAHFWRDAGKTSQR